MGFETLAIEYEDEVTIFEQKKINYGYYSDGVIGIKDSIRHSEKHCTLAEELGHYYTTHENENWRSAWLRTKECESSRRVYYC